MRIEEAWQFIKDAEQYGSRLGLQSITELLKRLGNPERCLKVIHVAGTNGKGSTCMMMASVLKAAGYRVGVYISPAVNGFHERIQIDGNSITDREIVETVMPLKAAVDKMGTVKPTEFELVTAMALYHFAAKACDLVILEVGLGGLADATNVIPTPLVAVMTPIALDHTQILGDSLEAIASIKAGIMKPGGITVTCQQEEPVMRVLKCTAETEDNTLYLASPDVLITDHITDEKVVVNYRGSKIALGLSAAYQANNANLAVNVLEKLESHYGYQIPADAYRRGLSEVKWPARMERIAERPLTLIDGAHNPHGIKALAQSLTAMYSNRRIIGVMGVLADKAVEEMLGTILPVLDGIVTTRPTSERALNAAALRMRIECDFETPVLGEFERVSDAIAYVKSHFNSDVIVVYFGSLYFLGEVRRAYL
ncbi:bifunctional folylpolyglutamate synthase/dihydrofolate synthase [Fusibacter paucivorans]|uniref:tetrahydrofolate synthase n=1 Tax=Fusibacter paucivorans TaxID=76009 RepID=A0ABS5PMQ3_9FIRM|nr:folylpolyglutamate synthase/dihydrofolate synthase family protein [Fusibacter paucivorans]MBS7525679.1 bifunctional folylpolyglutamate synthase/dihydrofolate synthase [Fusibacter paucivorans]